jgi:hypothetical protein
VVSKNTKCRGTLPVVLEGMDLIIYFVLCTVLAGVVLGRSQNHIVFTYRDVYSYAREEQGRIPRFVVVITEHEYTFSCSIISGITRDFRVGVDAN